MEYVVYILYSEKFAKNYTGVTSSIISRFQSHNKLATKGWTTRYRPWIVIHLEYFKSKSIALKQKKFFKSGQRRLERNSIIQTFLQNYK